MNLRKRRQHNHNSPKSGMIYCNSSYEIRAAILLDNDPDVLKYETQIRFKIKNKTRILDFLVYYKNNIKVIEVKPYRRICQYEQQIKDNQEYANRNGYDFTVWSESDLGFSKEIEITKWADEYLSSFDGVDYTEIRKQRGLDRVKKHYKNKIADDKITIFCKYCNCTHEPLKLTYNKNIRRNGQYICTNEGGFISGSKPKNKKNNPYAANGKKQCTLCNDILIFKEFGMDKSRSDGYASRCFKCRNTKK